ncbi:MAG: hypothetical protein ACKVS9_08770 [Phycisphaerae bacterium]
MAHDAGHEHPNPNLHDDPSAFPLTMSLVLSIIITIVSVVAIKMLHDTTTYELVQERVYDSPTQTPHQVLRAQQQADIASVRWVDREKKIVGLPIDQAIKLTASELASGKYPQPPASAPVAPAGAAGAKP